jgi:hypothetical protein
MIKAKTKQGIMASFFKCIWLFSGCMKNSQNPSTLIVQNQCSLVIPLGIGFEGRWAQQGHSLFNQFF